LIDGLLEGSFTIRDATKLLRDYEYYFGILSYFPETIFYAS